VPGCIAATSFRRLELRWHTVGVFIFERTIFVFLHLCTLPFFGDCFVKVLLMLHGGAFSASWSFSKRIKNKKNTTFDW